MNVDKFVDIILLRLYILAVEVSRFLCLYKLHLAYNLNALLRRLVTQ